MKKINSIHYGGKMLGGCTVIGVIIPILLFAAEQIIKIRVLHFAMWGFLLLGAVCFLSFFLYLGLELHQDRIIDQYYSTHKKTRVPLGHGFYECMACGNQKVKEQDRSCTSCGIVFEKDRTVQEILDMRKDKRGE